jgi:acyl-CoA-binding protein
VHTLSRKPGNSDLLDLYAFYKQALEGDVKGSRPSLLNVNGRLKHDAWAKLKGMSRSDAEAGYVRKVQALLRADGKGK